MNDKGKTEEQLIEELMGLRQLITKLEESETMRKRAEEALRESEERYRRMVSAVTAYTYFVEVSEGRAVSTRHSMGCLPVTGYSSGDYESNPNLWYSMIFPDDRMEVESSLAKLLAGNPVPPIEHRIIRYDGTVVWIRNTMVPHYDADGRLLRYDGLVEDITNRKLAEEALRASETLLQTIVETEPECVKLLASDGTLLKMNKAGLAMIQADSLEQVKGKSLYPLVMPEYRQSFEMLTEQVFRGETGTLDFEIVGIKGRRLWLETHAVPLRNEKNEIIALLGITRDITERKLMEEQLRTLSLTDELTRLYNRRGFFTLAEQQLRLAKRLRKGLSLISTDLDNLKEINDTFGHHEGDQMLIETADILRESFRESDIIARIGGDEFVILQTENSDISSETVASRLQKNIEIHSEKGNRSYKISISFGIVHYEAESRYSIDEMLAQADKLMYEHKRHKDEVLTGR